MQAKTNVGQRQCRRKVLDGNKLLRNSNIHKMQSLTCHMVTILIVLQNAKIPVSESVTVLYQISMQTKYHLPCIDRSLLSSSAIYA